MHSDNSGHLATLYDVAREAGVSLATASRALNGSTRKVNDAYRARVLAAAVKLGYSTNLSAQAVARGDSRTVALLVSDIADPYFSSIAAGVIKASEAQGLTVTMTVTNRDPAKEIAHVKMLRGQRPRVIILAGSRFSDDDQRDTLVAELEAYSAAGGRVVLISQRELPFDAVQIDNRQGARLLAEELVGLGYRRFAVLAGPKRLLTARHRLESFRKELRRAGIELAKGSVIFGGFTRDDAYASTLEFIDRGLGDTELIFAVNDVMAIGAMAALRERKIPVPKTVAVAGYDDIPIAQDVYPALTTVHVPLESAGADAVALALRDPTAGGASVTVEASVVIRASTPRK